MGHSGLMICIANYNKYALEILLFGIPTVDALRRGVKHILTLYVCSEIVDVDDADMYTHLSLFAIAMILAPSPFATIISIMLKSVVEASIVCVPMLQSSVHVFAVAHGLRY